MIRHARRAEDMPPDLLGKLEQVIRETEDRVEDEALAMMNAAASEREKLRLELYMAFLSSALAMGKDIQKLSWFGKNHVATMPARSQP